ncbi:MAG: DUF4390 domain-containing protein [Deltaproteobacteria bacterium]|nr:DUF4390 domain-containing protein [Deltaproteobacteria bacterium]
MRNTSQLIGPILVGLLIMLLGLAPAQAADDEPPLRKLGVALTGNDILASFSFGDAFTKNIKEKLTSGLPTRIVLQINLERQGSGKPVTFWAWSATIVYDLWEEVFVVSVEDNRGRRHARASTAKQAIDLASRLTRQPVADTSGLPPGVYRLRTLIEVNPVSKEMVEDIRRWLARPPSGKSDVQGQSNFFGSFVGIFVDRRIGHADHSVAFVSQWFRLGES